MKNATAEVLSQAIQLREEGQSNKEIMAATGLSHSQMERHFMAADIASGAISGGFIAQPDSATAKGAIITRLRNAGESWGLISVRFNEPESRTRKAFTEVTALDSKGLRIGKGGRYVMDDCRFYTGSDRAKLGEELDPTMPKLAQVPDPNTEAVRKLAKLAKAAEAKAKRDAKKASATA